MILLPTHSSPYWGKNFFSVLLLFFQRMVALLKGELSIADLASDEIQIFVLSLVAMACALIGTFLVLKKMTMLANSLSHTILLGIVIAYLSLFAFIPKESISAHAMSITTLLLASLITALLTAVLTQFLTTVFRLQEDASTGLVFTTLFALGIVLITAFTRNAHIGSEAIMGNVDALHLDDLYLIFWVFLFDSAIIALLYKEWKMTTFDSSFAQSIGFSPTLFNYLLMILTSVTAIGAFRAVGVLLVLAFLIAPVLTARLFCHRLFTLILCSMVIAIVSSLSSVALSRHCLSVYQISFSTAGLTVTLLGVLYFTALFVRWFLKLTLRKNPKVS